MPTEVLQKTKVEYSFQSSSYSPTGNNDLSDGSPTVVDLSLGLTGGVADGAAMNSDQVDLGAVRPHEFTLIAAIEFFAAVAAGKTIDFYWSPSANSSVGVGNPGDPDGVDGDYTGDGGGTVAETVLQMIWIGSFVTTDLVGVQKAIVGTFAPKLRYGQLVVVNRSGATICGTDDIETSILMSGTIPEGQ